jgi:ubiquinone/menaquinone biosynthesis C-methylase UbiE
MTYYSLKQVYESEKGWYLFDAAWRNWKFMFSQIEGQSLLDLGSGAGVSLALAKVFNPDLKVLGLEGDSNVLEVSEQRGVSTRSGDIYSLPFDDAEFDTVWSSHVLEHLEKPTAAISESWRVAKKRIIHSVPVGDVDDKNLGSKHLHIFNRKNFTELFLDTCPGSKSMKITYIEDTYMSSFVMVVDK